MKDITDPVVKAIIECCSIVEKMLLDKPVKQPDLVKPSWTRHVIGILI